MKHIRFPEDYLSKEKTYCHKETEAFYADPTEENRMLVLNKRVEYENLYYKKKQLDLLS